MTHARAVVALSLLAVVVALTGVARPFGAMVLGVFALYAPGARIGRRLGAPDGFTTAAAILATSLAIDALVGETLLLVHAFDGRVFVGVLGAWCIATNLGTARHDSTPLPELDPATPALLVRVGRYPVNHGAVNAARTLGRAGVPVAAVVEDGWTPLALSRYTARAFVSPSNGDEAADELVARIQAIAAQIGRPTVAVATDDEAAVLLAEHAEVLRPALLLPRIEAGLTRRLASKRGLYELCVEHGVPTPTTAFPQDRDDVERFAASATFPIVVKNVEPFTRLSHSAVGGTTVVHCAEDLLALASTWETPRHAMFQEFIPHEESQDWSYQTYCDDDAAPVVSFTCVKLRSWPPHAGITALARALPNPELERVAGNFCRAIGYRGVASLDWRLDERDGQYKLLDFNPRMGAQFSLFETEHGVDIVRAMHLDLSGRSVPRSPSVAGRALRVELLDLPARIVYGRTTAPAPRQAHKGPRPRLAWSTGDDIVPAIVMVVRSVGPSLARIACMARLRRSEGPAIPEVLDDQAVSRT